MYISRVKISDATENHKQVNNNMTSKSKKRKQSMLDPSSLFFIDHPLLFVLPEIALVCLNRKSNTKIELVLKNKKKPKYYCNYKPNEMETKNITIVCVFKFKIYIQ